MKRRSFIKAAAMSGLALSAPALVTRSNAQPAPYDGPYWIFVQASGAWDPQFFFDPTLRAEHNRIYTSIEQVGSISYAPWTVDPDALGLDSSIDYSYYLLSPGDFLNRFGNRLTVINGIDTSTNNHDSGKRTMGSGRLALGYPALGALIAAAKAPEKPMAFLSAGGYDQTNGMVPTARVDNVGALRKVARPNEIDPFEADTERYHTPDTMARIRQLQDERLAAMQAKQRLPSLKRSMSELTLARANMGQLADLVLPDDLVDLGSYNLGDLERMMQQAQLSIAAFKSGLAVSTSLSLGGFDTHGNHDRDQRRQLAKLFGGIAYLMDELSAAGLADKAYVVAISDFGRGPYYNGSNDNAGKDHWPVTSMFAMGPNIAGDRVIGGTNDDQQARKVNPDTLAVDDGGITLKPELVHKALRRAAGIADSPEAGSYPLLGEDLNLFG